MNAREDLQIPEDTEFSTEEEEQLQKKKGEALNLFSPTNSFNMSTLFSGVQAKSSQLVSVVNMVATGSPF